MMRLIFLQSQERKTGKYSEKNKHFQGFKYIILQIVLTKKSDKEIVELEAKHKNIFMTRIFGLNSN